MRLAVISLSIATVLCTGCSEAPFPNADELDALKGLHSLPSQPPEDPTNRLADDPAAISFGKKLFEDRSLSGCGTVSCASCHGGDALSFNEPTAPGCDGHRTTRNTPTVLNSGYLTWYMADGRADRLWSQAVLPLLNPNEMASTPALLRQRLSTTYASEYSALFGQNPELTSDEAVLANVGKVIAAFERTQNRTRAPFDDDVQRFLAAVEAGTEESDPAYLGLKTFVRKGGCVLCHKGPNLTDQSFHTIGIADDSATGRGAAEALPTMLQWAFNATGSYSDDRSGNAANRLSNIDSQLRTRGSEFEGAWKTASLRNVALTPPYMHTGALASLDEVIEFYNRGGDEAGSHAGTTTVTVHPLDLSDDEKRALRELLESMTGDAPGH